MKKNKTVRPELIGPGFYVAFGSDLGMVGFFKVVDHPIYGLTVWGLSRWRGSIAYRTLGLKLKEWLEVQPKGVQYRPDINRSGWEKP